jgi:hypothetical protein
MQQQHAMIRKGYVAADFMTRTYRISGEVELREPLIDQLNDLNAQFLTLERMFVSPLLDPATLTGHYEVGEIRKDRIGIVLLNDKKAGLPFREGKYIGRDNKDFPVVFVAAGFEVTGMLRQHPSVNIINFVRTTPEDFILLFDATATLAAHRQHVFSAPALLLSRPQIEVFAMGVGA